MLLQNISMRKISQKTRYMRKMRKYSHLIKNEKEMVICLTAAIHKEQKMKRRNFLKTIAGIILGYSAGGCSVNIPDKKIQLGCLNRPWKKFSLEETLTGVKEAGFTCMGLFRNRRYFVIKPGTPQSDYLNVKESLLKHNLNFVSYSPHIDLTKSPKEIIAEHSSIMKILQWMGCSHIIAMGTNKKEYYSKFYETMKYYADAAAQYDIHVVLKFHGGISSSGALCAEAVEKVNSDNFRICYDPANIYYYDKFDPVEELKVAAEYVTAMCVKDYRLTGEEKPDIMVTPGDGEVDFEQIFKILKKHNFSGPCLVECLAGDTLEEVNYEAKRAYTYLSALV